MKCNWDVCKEEATHAIRLLIPARGVPFDMHQPVELYLGVEACYDHATAFDAKEFVKLNSPLFRSMRDNLQSDLNRIVVSPVPMDHPGYLKFKELQTKEQS